MESAPGPETTIDGVCYLYFGGTSYLGLHGHPQVIEAGCAALKKYGVHTATTRAGFGTSPLVLEVEKLAQRFFAADEAFYFAAGYSANHILMPILARTAAAIFLDEHAHFCLEEAVRLTGKPVHRFRHHDPANLRLQLENHLPEGGAPLVLSDGVVSATGRVAPVRSLVEVLSRFAPAMLHLDDAHGFGVLGENGRGTWEAAGLWNHVNGGEPFEGVALSVCGTLAKALGGFGGIVTGTQEFVEASRTSSHYFDGASAPACPLAGSTAAALGLLLSDPSPRDRLRRTVRRVRRGLQDLGIQVSDEASANVGFTVGDASHMRRVHEHLREHRILVPYLPAYSGVGAEGVLRLAVCSEHTDSMIDRLLQALSQAVGRT